MLFVVMESDLSTPVWIFFSSMLMTRVY